MAVRGQGLTQPAVALEQQWQALTQSGERTRRQRRVAMGLLVEELIAQIREKVLEDLQGRPGLEQLLHRTASGEADPYAVAREIRSNFRTGVTKDG